MESSLPLTKSIAVPSKCIFSVIVSAFMTNADLSTIHNPSRSVSSFTSFALVFGAGVCSYHLPCMSLTQ